MKMDNVSVALIAVLGLSACLPGAESAANKTCAKEAARANLRCLEFAFEKCGGYSSDPDSCPAARQVDEACDAFVDEELRSCQ